MQNPLIGVRHTLAEARTLRDELRALGHAHAPATLVPAVLTRIGLTAAADHYAPIDTPLGTVLVAYNAAGVSTVSHGLTPTDFEAAFRARFGRLARPAAEVPPRLARALAQTLANGRVPDALRFDLRGLSAFERAVLLKALEIPRGEVRPYGWVAREIGAPGAVRAVGSALGRNPIPLLIPCHRVVRSGGQIGNYAWGHDAKVAVLQAEGADPTNLERLAKSGVRYVGSDTTRVYCFPTCRHARRIGEAHRVPFSSDRAATAAGYRPCKVCRPALAQTA